MSADNPRPRETDKPAETGGGSLDRPVPEAETRPRQLHEPRSMAEHSADVHSRPPIPGYNPFATDGNYIVEPGHEFGPPPADRRATPPASRHPETTQTQPPELSERAGALHPSATPDSTARPGDARPEGNADRGVDEKRPDEQRWAAIERRIMASVDQFKAEARADGKARIAEAKAELDAKLSAAKAELDEKLASLKNEIGKLGGEDKRGGADKPSDTDKPRGVDRPDPTRPAHPDIPARHPADYPRTSYDTPKPRAEVPHVSPENWIEAINPPEPGHGRNGTRQFNCGECARSTDGTWQGRPRVAEAIDYPRLLGEDKERMEEWAGTECTDASMTDVKQELDRLGPGSSAIVGFIRENGRGHWFNAVNDAGTVKAVDGQTEKIGPWPPSREVFRYSEAIMAESFAIYVRPDGEIAK